MTSMKLRGGCCVLSADLISHVPWIIKLPHGHPPATTVPQGLYCVVDETHQITFDRCIYYIVAVCLDKWGKRWKNLAPHCTVKARKTLWPVDTIKALITSLITGYLFRVLVQVDTRQEHRCLDVVG